MKAHENAKFWQRDWKIGMDIHFALINADEAYLAAIFETNVVAEDRVSEKLWKLDNAHWPTASNIGNAVIDGSLITKGFVGNVSVLVLGEVAEV